MFPNSVTPVLLQAAVHVRENKANRAEEILSQFANKFPDKSKIVLLARAQIASTAGQAQIAAESLLRIPDIQHRRIEALVRLIRTAAHTDVEKAEAYEKKLKPLGGVKGIDVENLEKSSGAKSFDSGPAGSGVTEAYEVKGKEKMKKRKKKPKYPKGFDPANPGPLPDLERWLPKRERSSYRPKRKDKRAPQVRGSQGAVLKEFDHFDGNVSSKSNQAVESKGATYQNVSSLHLKNSKSRKKSRK